jgi:hypothetical protein
LPGTEAAAVAGHTRRPVECRDPGRERVDVRRIELAARSTLLASPSCGKFAHLHGVFDCRSAAAQDRRVDAAGDFDDIEVKLRRETTIEAQLLFAIVRRAANVRKSRNPRSTPS